MSVLKKLTWGRRKLQLDMVWDHGHIVLDIKLFEYLGTVRASGE